jgi:NACHT domain
VVFEWLMAAALGPAAVAVPVDWAAGAGARVALGWFHRFRRTDDLSRLVKAAVGPSVGLSDAEFDSVRALLEDPRTWQALGGGSVGDLAARIAECLPSGRGRTAEDSRVAGLAIARGLLEFAVWDLKPRVFQQVLLARLERMETGLATSLDQVLLDLHADLTADVREQVGRVLDRLPPGPAERDEIVVYLTALIRWLNTDPWPGHRQFNGPVLTPAGIERKLWLRAYSQAPGPDLDADELAERCRRLVVLGGPGTGKTWLARRTARRCAEQALWAIQGGSTLDDVELPLFTTCSALLAAPGDIRQAAVSGALNQLGDLGGSKVTAALQVLFTERNAPTLLVLDSLDEAEASGKQIRRADTLPWRIVLTSRPNSWNGQLAVCAENLDDQVCELQPLSYPDDVEPFIQQWFSQQPERGSELMAQIAKRQYLQKAATVPLILAFYCIIGAGNPLPQFRRELYTMVILRLLTGRWRGDEVSHLNPGPCMDRLRDWAWSGTEPDPVSGVGRWADYVVVAGYPSGEAADSALDNIATPQGPPQIDTGRMKRRFIHQSVREHLVAEYVARLPVDLAAAELLPHLWYDPDWEYAAPAALVMHAQHDQLLWRLICLAARSDDVPKDLSVIDAGWEFRGFLARVAGESSQAEWSHETARIIGQARVELATAGRTADLSRALSWPTSNGQIREALLGLIAVHSDDFLTVGEAARMVAELVPTAQERAELREALLRLLADHSDEMAGTLAGMVARLAETAQERAQVRGAVLEVLTAYDRPWVAEPLAQIVARLAETAQERAQVREVLLRLMLDRPLTADELVDVVAGLVPTAQERAQLREALLRLMAARRDEPLMVGELARMAASLAMTPEERAQVREALLELLTDSRLIVDELAEVVAGLNPTAPERAQLQEALMRTLAAPHDNLWTAAAQAGVLAQLAERPEERARVREVLLGLASRSDDMATALAEEAAALGLTALERAQLREALLRVLAARSDKVASTLAGLARTSEERAQVREALLVVLATQDRPQTSGALAGIAAGLAETLEERTQVREVLLELLAARENPDTVRVLAEVMAQLGPTVHERAQLRELLLGLLAAPRNPYTLDGLMGLVARLAPTAHERAQLREALLGLMDAYRNEPLTINELAQMAAELDPTTQERAQLRTELLGLLAAPRNPYTLDGLMGLVARLAPTAHERAQLRKALLGLLDVHEDPDMVGELAAVVAELDPTAQERAQLRKTLLRALAAAQKNKPLTVGPLAQMVAELAATPEERTHVREALLGLLPARDHLGVRGKPVSAMTRLHPIAAPAGNWHSWSFSPTIDLLAVVRQNSALADWLAVLPSLSSLSS